MHLSPDEEALILQHRHSSACQSALPHIQVEVSLLFLEWSEYSASTGENLTFSTFVNSFGYQNRVQEAYKEFGKDLYEALTDLIKVLRPRIESLSSSVVSQSAHGEHETK